MPRPRPPPRTEPRSAPCARRPRASPVRARCGARSPRPAGRLPVARPARAASPPASLRRRSPARPPRRPARAPPPAASRMPHARARRRRHRSGATGAAHRGGRARASGGPRPRAGPPPAPRRPGPMHCRRPQPAPSRTCLLSLARCGPSYRAPDPVHGPRPARSRSMGAMSDDGQSPPPQPGQNPEPQPGPQAQAANSDRTDPHPPMPRDERGWQVAPAPDGRGMPEQRRAPAHRRPASCGSCSRCSPSTGCRCCCSSREAKPRDGAVQPVFLEQVRRAGQVDLLQATPSKGVQGKAPLPAQRQERDPDEAVRDQVPSFWNGSQLRPCSRKRTSDQRQVDHPRPLDPGGAAARVRADAADHRAVRAAGNGRPAAGRRSARNFGRSRARGSTPRRSG